MPNLESINKKRSRNREIHTRGHPITCNYIYKISSPFLSFSPLNKKQKEIIDKYDYTY